MKYSVIFKTCRKEPKFEWFIESYYSQIKGLKEEFELIIIDAQLWYNFEDRKNKVSTLINNRFNYIHIPPKPSNWQGPYRKTKYNYFDAASSINTGLIVCSGEYVILFDDCVVLLPGCIQSHIYASEHNVCGSGTQITGQDIVVEDGYPVKFTPVYSSFIKNEIKNTIGPGIPDWQNIRFDTFDIGGGWWHGQNSSAYLNLLLKCNGSDEYTARYDCEDMDLGCRLFNIPGNKLKKFPLAVCLEGCVENDVEKCNDPDWPVRCFSKDRMYDEEFNKMCTDKFHEIYYNENGPGTLTPALTPSCGNSNKRIDVVNLPWSKVDLIASRNYYKQTGKFLMPNIITHCPFSGLPIGEI